MVFLAFVQPLFAIDVGEIVVGLVALIIVIIRQLIEANRTAGAKPPKPPVAPKPLQPEPIQAPMPAGGQQADPLRAQVEEFLRRAGQPAGQKQPQPKPELARPVEVRARPTQPIEERTVGQPLRQASWRQSPPTAAPPSTPAKEQQRQPRGGKSRKRQSVAEHVAEQVTSRADNLAKQASKLGQRIVAEDQQFDVQLKSKFDHKLGTLASSDSASTAETAAPAAPTPASELAAMLANPSGIRQAILINEILRRPTDRW